MSSIFSFIRPPEAESEPPAAVPPEAPAPAGPEPAVAAVAAAAMPAPIPPVLAAAIHSIVELTSVAQVPAAIAATLNVYIDPTTPPLPPSGIIILNITDKSLGLGNFRGLDLRGIFPAVELKGGHADALVRFQLWGATPDEVNAATLALQGRLLAARADLWDAGFLEMSGVGGTLAEQQVTDGPWTRSLDYHILFEYHLAPTAGAESLIARIPVNADQEVFNSLPREVSVVTDDMARWDQLSAPTLVVRGATRVARLAILAYFQSALAGGPVTLLRTFDGASGPPAVFAGLGDFLSGLADPAAPSRHGQFAFASMADLMTACTLAGDPFPLGDWDSNLLPDIYQSMELVLDPPIQLPGATDRLEILPGTAPLDQTGVVYLRALRS